MIFLILIFEGYHYDPSEVKIHQEGSDLSVTVEGLWYRTILWEVPLLALISELHYEMNHMERDSNEVVMSKTLEKADSLANLELILQNSEPEEDILIKYRIW
jgi:nicotinate phosphoribosyltransferase